MKVRLEDGYKDRYTISELEVAKRVIREVAGDETTAKEWAEYAAREVVRGTTDWVLEVLKASAQTAKNSRAWDVHFEGSGHMDVWVEGLARTCECIIEFGAYLSDIWQSGAEPYRDHMYIRIYKEVRK